MSTWPSWNSSQAAAYQLPVSATGSQVPSQRVAKESSTTVAIMAMRLRRKKPTSTHSTVLHSFAQIVVSRIILCRQKPSR